MNEFGVVLFHSSSSAMQAEAVLVRRSYSVKLIPTPRHLSSDCGISLRFDWTCREEVQGLLERSRVEVAGIHPLRER